MTKENQATRRLRIGLVGAGKMGKHHATAVRRLDDLAELVAIADGSADARAAAEAELGVRTFATVAEMLETGDVDVVHICTDPGTHVALAEQVLRRGVHVYVEKPIAPTVEEMRRLVALAEENGATICAGHQLLFEAPMVSLRRYLPALGRAVHVESYFSFRTVRRSPGGRVPLRADLQLLDILPHPVYLLLEVLRLAEPDERTELKGIDVGPTGTVHALLARGRTTGVLVVTLEGRPVESYLRVVGTGGAAHADFVRGTLQRLIGPGVSGIDKVLNPYRTATQMVTGTTRALARRFVRRQRSYPGLAELFEAFYGSILKGSPAPTPPEALEETVAIWEEVASALARNAALAEELVGPPRTGPLVVVTGGTGFLGRATAERLLARGFAVRVLARRLPPAWERVHGAGYAVADLGAGVSPDLLEGAVAVVHCAAETAGGWAEHQRNSIDATEHIMRAAAEAGVGRFVHVSSMAVVRAGRGLASERSPVEADGRSRGPYVWGKLISERRAAELARELGLELRIVRPGAIVDSDDFDPPGRLGKRIGPMFVAVGSRNGRFGTVERSFAADVLAWTVAHFDEAPPLLHLVDAELPARREMVEGMRRRNPDLRVIWLPNFLLVPMSGAAVVLQRILRPGRKPIHLARVFADQPLDTSVIATIRDRLRLEQGSPGAGEERELPATAASMG